MKISEILQKKKITLSFEIFPPKQQANFNNVVNTAVNLSSLNPDFMSITYGAGGTTRGNTVEIAQKILESGTPALAHLTCVGNTEESIKSDIQKMKTAGIQNILALRGDVPQGQTIESATTESLRHADQLVTILKKEGFCVGGACYPEGHPESANRADDIENLKYKVDAGVDFLTTQMFFDNNMLYSYLYRLQSKGIHLPVFAGIMPIVNSNQVERMVKLSSAYIPEKLLSICDRFADNAPAMRQAGIAYATDQIIDLISNGIRGIHIYAMNKVDVVTDIVKNIDRIMEAVND
ncbi:methylenetetrahydrofolate reductase (NADPH) [Treponema rectale]|uniref:Methylenetetrahydrofolate reductase n=1 Tax=Treponema rectale TaxID=744512 RepID=A0A840SJB1_9SPIR|nr:methylenetetrahydrofolate reductase [NAD(P)H] [Treponema rectale]MBB5219462.1 methylenetetrahydrofolate reductase (NADPH) [Treponema rectale]